MLNWNILFISIIVFFLSSCGFKPVYKVDNSNNNYQLHNIDIEAINTIEGAEFYNQLKNILPHGPNAKYQLITNLSFSENYSIIQTNADVLRETITVNVNFKLINKSTSEVLISNNFSKLYSYSITFSPYSNLVQKQEILKNLSLMVAEEIRNRIIIHFSSK